MAFACRHVTFSLSVHVPLTATVHEAGQPTPASLINIHMFILKPNPESKLNSMTSFCK